MDANALGPVGRMATRVDLGAKVRAYVALTKPRIIELLLITTVPTMFVAAVRVPSARLVLETLVGGTLAAGGANAMNMVYDRDIDAVMNRTKRRPLVTGEVTPRAALVFAIALELCAFVVFATTVNVLSGVLALGATAFYVLVYTMWLKRSSRQNIVIGGAAGAMPVLVGWSAVTDHLALAPVVMFGIIFLWTPPHFWALAVRYREDYASANVPMLPVVAELPSVVRQICGYTLALWLCSLALVPVAHMGWLYGAVAVVAGGAFFWKALSLRQDATPKAAMGMFGYSITYLTVLFVAMGLDALIRHP
ncbi:MAG TPA: heme o synthase [Acidimicrobiales bacterium]|nr:heme o synthase [Acidimicrobiales bacterium]